VTLPDATRNPRMVRAWVDSWLLIARPVSPVHVACLCVCDVCVLRFRFGVYCVLVLPFFAPYWLGAVLLCRHVWLAVGRFRYLVSRSLYVGQAVRVFASCALCLGRVCLCVCVVRS
jgi:hypothetical protein